MLYIDKSRIHELAANAVSAIGSARDSAGSPVFAHAIEAGRLEAAVLGMLTALTGEQYVIVVPPKPAIVPAAPAKESDDIPPGI